MIEFIIRLILGRSRYSEYLEKANDTESKTRLARQNALKLRVDATATITTFRGK